MICGGPRCTRNFRRSMMLRWEHSCATRGSASRSSMRRASRCGRACVPHDQRRPDGRPQLRSCSAQTTCYPATFWKCLPRAQTTRRSSSSCARFAALKSLPMPSRRPPSASHAAHLHRCGPPKLMKINRGEASRMASMPAQPVPAFVGDGMAIVTGRESCSRRPHAKRRQSCQPCRWASERSM